jgi:glycosyltransferase involved in cell wall biosynthesis
MRILHVAHRFLPRFSTGVEVYVASLAGALRARGHTQQIFAGDPTTHATQTYTWEGLPVQTMPWGLNGKSDPVRTFLAGFFNPAVERQFHQVCAEFKPDVVHVHHLMGLSPHLPAIARTSGAAVVITLHDYWFICSNTWLYRYSQRLCPGPGFGYHCGGCALHRLHRPPQPWIMIVAAPLFVARTALLRRALLHAQRIIAPSQLVADLHIRHGLSPERIVLLPHGLVGSDEADRAPQSPARPSLRFVCVGTLIRPKGAHVVVEAFRGLDSSACELWLVGDAEADIAYTRELRALAAGDARITFTGTLTRDEVCALLRSADILLMPSLLYETHSLSVDEALAAGVPVVVSAHGAAAERVREGHDGLMAPPGDVNAWRRQMQRFLNEPALLPSLRSRLRRPVSLADHALQIESLYAELSSGGETPLPGRTRK